MHNKKNFKRNVIFSAKKIFDLTEDRTEILAKKAGIHLYIDEDFSDYLKNIVMNKKKVLKKLKDEVISERMLNYFFNGKIPNKPSLLAIAVVLELNLEETELLLKKAGYTLSKSIYFDIVVKKYIKETENGKNGGGKIEEINEILYNLSLPMLMTREKIKSDN